MTGLALLLVLASAILHASWNLFAKRAGETGWAFVWMAAVGSTILYAPVVGGFVLIKDVRISFVQLEVIVGTSFLHLAYFLLLQRGYREGDLSLVYPIARGTGPVLTMIAAVVLLSERPTPLAIAGATLVCVGVLSLGAGGMGKGEVSAGLAYGIATGVMIAIYTLWDKNAVTAIGIPPLILGWGSEVGRSILLAPAALRQRRRIAEAWKTHRVGVTVVALFGPLAYLLVLTALVFTPVSYVAPLRETSVLIGAFLGTRILGEQGGRRRVVSAAAIAAGVISLAIG